PTSNVQRSTFNVERATSDAMPGGEGAAAMPAGLPVAAQVASAPQAAAASPPSSKSADFKIIGILGKLYILMENAGGLVLVDQHAAHERVLFEEMRRRMEDQGVPMQRLLLPITLQIGPRDADWIARHLDAFARAGIGLEPF